MFFSPYRIFEKNYQEFRSTSLFSRISYVLIEEFKQLIFHLILVQKLSNFIISFHRAIKIFDNFLRIIHQVISHISNFYAIWSLQKPKCLFNISPKNPKLFSSLYKTFRILE